MITMKCKRMSCGVAKKAGMRMVRRFTVRNLRGFCSSLSPNYPENSEALIRSLHYMPRFSFQELRRGFVCCTFLKLRCL